MKERLLLHQDCRERLAGWDAYVGAMPAALLPDRLGRTAAGYWTKEQDKAGA